MATTAKKANPARIVTGKVRLSFTYLKEPDEDDNGNLAYRSMILIPKSDKVTIKKMQIAIQAATIKFAKGDKAKAAKLLKHPKWHKPIRNPDNEDEESYGGEQYEGMFFLTAKNKDRPGLLLKNGTRVDSLDMIDKHFYSGAFVNCSLSFFPYDQKGNKGVGVYLNNIIKNSDGERLDGRVSAEDELSEFIDESDTSGLEGLDDDLDMGLDDDLGGDDTPDDDDFDLDL